MASPKRILFLVGRDNWQKNDHLNKIFLKTIFTFPVKVAWEDPAGGWIYRLRRLEEKIWWLPEPIRKMNLRSVQILFGIFHWSYFGYLRDTKKDFAIRCRNLRRRILSLGIGKDITILSYSSGGRASSLIADGLGIRRIICIGYPFKNPNRGDEPERYAHLSGLRTPMLIVQGARDEYGGSEAAEQYAVGPHVEFYFLDSDHDYHFTERQLRTVLDKVRDAILHPSEIPVGLR